MPDRLKLALLKSRHAEMIATRRFFLLFVILLGSLVFYPLTQGNGSRYYLFRFLGSAAVVLSVYAVSFRRGMLMSPHCSRYRHSWAAFSCSSSMPAPCPLSASR